MIRRGRYYKRLFTVLLALCILVFVVPQVIFVGSYIQTYQKQYDSTMQYALKSRTDGIELALSAISAGLNAVVSDPNLTQWGNSQLDSPSYYYLAARGLESVKTTFSGLTSVNYSVAITTLDKDSMVISRDGTSSKEWYFTHATTLGREQTESIFSHFAKSRQPLTIATYDLGGRLLELYYIVTRSTYTGGSTIYITSIPFQEAFGGSPVILLDSSQNVWYSDTALSESGLTAELQSALRESPIRSFLDRDEHQVYIEPLRSMDWWVAYLYPRPPFGGWQLAVLLCCLAFTLMFVAVRACSLITKKLYRPIKEAVEHVAGNKKEGLALGQSVDEFQLFHQSTDRIRDLTDELHCILHEKAIISSKQLYRDLLLGTAAPQAPGSESQSYCVCLMELLEEDGSKLFLIKNRIEVYVQETENAHYVSMGRELAAIIIELDSLDEAKTMILQLLAGLEMWTEHCIAISDVMEGSRQICACYRQAVKILEFRYLSEKAEILTMQQVNQFDDSGYYYPIKTEKRLIQCAAEGNREAIEIYRELLHENGSVRSLSPEMQKNFRFALLGTVGRVFQELKTTPEKLLGESIDFDALYDEWNSPALLDKLEGIISAVITAAEERGRNIDNEILQAMTLYIHQNYSDDIMLSDMSRAFNISPKYCSMLFKRLSDDTFKNYLNRYRIERAKEFISQNPSIKIGDLSVMVGFNSANSFIRVFSRYVGVTPRVFADEVKGRG